MNGGDDETRTRDLCRDRIHSLDSAESVGYVGNSRQPSGLLGMVGRILCNGLCNASAFLNPRRKAQLRPHSAGRPAWKSQSNPATAASASSGLSEGACHLSTAHVTAPRSARKKGIARGENALRPIHARSCVVTIV